MVQGYMKKGEKKISEDKKKAIPKADTAGISTTVNSTTPLFPSQFPPSF